MVFFYLHLISHTRWSKVWFEILDIAFALINPSLGSCLTLGDIHSEAEMSRAGVLSVSKELIKQAGCVEMVIFDKTGTLTTNQITLKCIEDISGVSKVFSDLDALTQTAILTCHAVVENRGDAIDLEMLKYSGGRIEDDGLTRRAYSNGSDECLRVLHIHQFNSFDARMSVVVENLKTGVVSIFTKGSIESIKSICSKVNPKLLASALEYCKNGFRVLGVCWKSGPSRFIRSEDEIGMEFLCVIVFQDKIKIESPGIISELKVANIPTKMCTGDSVFTGLQVAREVGMINSCTTVLFPSTSEGFGMQLFDEDGQLVEFDYSFEKASFQPRNLDSKEFVFAIKGDIFCKLIDSSLRDLVLNHSIVFARFDPEMKQSLVKYFGEKSSVMFVGDGGNDIGALSAASTSLSLSSSKIVSAAQFSGLDLKYCIDIIKIGRSALAMSCAQFRFCFYNTLLSGINIMANLYYGFSPSDGSCLFSDISAYYILSNFLIWFKPSKTIDSSKIKTNLLKTSFFDFIELIYIFLVLLTSSRFCGKSISGKIPEQSTNSTVTFLGSSFIIGMIFFRSGNFVPHRESRKHTSSFLMCFAVYFTNWAFILLGLYLEWGYILRAMDFVPLSKKHWVVAFTMLSFLAGTPFISMLLSHFSR